MLENAVLAVRCRLWADGMQRPAAAHVPPCATAAAAARVHAAHRRSPALLPALLQVETWGQRLLVGTAVGYMLLIVVIPFVNVFVQAFSHGLGPFAETLAEPDFQQVSASLLAAEDAC